MGRQANPQMAGAEKLAQLGRATCDPAAHPAEFSEMAVPVPSTMESGEDVSDTLSGPRLLARGTPGPWRCLTSTSARRIRANRGRDICSYLPRRKAVKQGCEIASCELFIGQGRRYNINELPTLELLFYIEPLPKTGRLGSNRYLRLTLLILSI